MEIPVAGTAVHAQPGSWSNTAIPVNFYMQGTCHVLAFLEFPAFLLLTRPRLLKIDKRSNRVFINFQIRPQLNSSLVWASYINQGKYTRNDTRKKLIYLKSTIS